MLGDCTTTHTELENSVPGLFPAKSSCHATSRGKNNAKQRFLCELTCRWVSKRISEIHGTDTICHQKVRTTRGTRSTQAYRLRPKGMWKSLVAKQGVHIQLFKTIEYTSGHQRKHGEWTCPKLACSRNDPISMSTRTNSSTMILCFAV